MARIIIADDAIFARKVIRDIVEKVGHIVVGEAADGEIAIKLYNEKKPDIVIMDITMPNTNGLEALEEILKFDEKANIIICSAICRSDMICKAVKMGAKDFIVKPVDEEKTLDAINRIIDIESIDLLY
jgi:two-component system chemotaxis response regulator CheY